jgi:hypothetical protein
MKMEGQAKPNKKLGAALLLAAAVLPAALLGPLASQAQSEKGAEAPDRATMTRGELVKKVSNEAGFNENPGPQLFQDVPSSNHYYRYVNRLANRGIISGYTCGGPGEPCVAPNNLPYFRPEANALRGQATKVISSAAGFDEEVSGYTFVDVAPGSTFYVWTERLASRGIVEGFACGGPGEPCYAPENPPYFRPFDNLAKRDANRMIESAFEEGGDNDDGDNDDDSSEGGAED